MWKLFSNKKRQDYPGGWSVLDSVLKLTDTTQRKCSGWMNRKSSRWTTRQTKTYLVLFCLVTAGGGALILWDTFHGKTSTVVVPIGSAPIVPALPTSPDVVLNDQDISAILGVSQYLDSLKGTPDGRKLYDELARERPGFIDSLEDLKAFLIK